jgi:methanesulfonate monooxygenase large subunit
MAARDARAWETPPDIDGEGLVSGAVYTDAAIFADELRTIFQPSWRLVCHESELANAFDYRSFDHVGQPLFCIRGEDGEVRTFINACSHRGARLLSEPAGNARRITCFYHHWTYDAAGACIAIPRAEGYAASGLGKAGMGLRAVRTEVKLGLVFITMDEAAAPLDEFLAGALDPFEPIMGGGALEIFHFSRSVLNCNWKAWQETNLDLYHENMHVVLRKTQRDAMPMAERKIRIYGHGHAGSGKMVAAYEGYQGFAGRGSDVPPLPGTDAADFRFSVLFPATAVLSRGTVMRIDTVIPISETQTVLEMRGLGLKGDSEAERRVRFRHFNQYWGPMGRNVPEDMFAAEACDAAFRHGAARYQIIARDEGLTGQDDAPLRSFYAEWAKRTGRRADAPTKRGADAATRRGADAPGAP